MRKLLLCLMVLSLGCGSEDNSPSPSPGVGGSSTGGGGGNGGGSSGAAGSIGGAGGSTNCNANLQQDAKNCGACGHDCQGGTCLGGSCQPVQITTIPQSPRWVAVDDTTAYFSYHRRETISEEWLAKAPITGGSWEPLGPESGDTVLNEGLGLTVLDKKLYILSHQCCVAPNVWYFDTVTKKFGEESLDLNGPDDIYLRLPGAYYVQNYAARYSSFGSDEDVYLFPEGKDLDDGWSARAIAAGTDVVYWAAAKSTATPPVRAIWQKREGKDIEMLLSQPTTGDGIADGDFSKLLLDGNTLYALVSSSYPASTTLVKVDLDGKKLVKLAPSSPMIWDLKVDGDGFYWTTGTAEGQDGQVLMLPKGSSTPVVKASSQPDPRGLALDSRCIYWANGAKDGVDGSLFRVAK